MENEDKKMDRSVRIDGSNSGNIITGDDNNIYLPPHKVSQVLAGKVGLSSEINFAGRKKELEKIDELLSKKSTVLLMHGIGGIGKSTLASYYFNQQKDKFDYCGFIQVGKDIKSSFVSALLSSLNLQKENIDDLFNESIVKLQNLKGNKLLVIDDLNDIANNKDEINTIVTLKNYGFKILFTSRESDENIPKYFLDTMNPEDAKELFLKYYPTEEMDKVNKVLKYLDYHPLFIEMTAKVLKNKSKLTLQDINDKFKYGKFPEISIKRRSTFDDYLNELFDLEGLDKDERLLLKQLSILPSFEISLETLECIFQRKDEEFEEILNYLVEKGWLSSVNGDYKLHQIIKEYILKNHLATFDDIRTIIDYFNKGDSSDPVYAVQNKKYLEYFYSISKIVDKYNTNEIFSFYTNMGHLHRYLGSYTISLECFKKVEVYIKENYSDRNINLAATYTNQALVYVELEEYPVALSMYLKSIDIKEDLLKEEEYSEYFKTLNISLATGYNNLAELYSQKESTLDKAFEFYKKSLKMRQEILGEDDSATATSYRNLGQYFLKAGDCKEALFNFNKALDIRKRKLDQNHPYIAQSNGDLALGYSCLGDKEKPLEFFMKALEIEEKVWGEKNIDTAKTYYNIGDSFFVLNNRGEALKYTQKALHIWKELLPNNHSHINQAKTLINLINKI